MVFLQVHGSKRLGGPSADNDQHRLTTVAGRTWVAARPRWHQMPVACFIRSIGIELLPAASCRPRQETE